MMIVFKESIIEGLELLSDYEFQKVAWFDNDQDIWYTYNENVEDIFDFVGLPEAWAAGLIVFDRKTDQALRDLETACNTLGYKWSGKEDILLESKEMAIIREMAKQCLQLIAACDYAESGVRFVKPGESQS